MLLAHIEWISALCATLTLICVIQLILAGFLLWSIPEVLTLTKSHIATLAGLIAGFTTLPAVIRFKTARMTPKMDRIYGYTLCYQRLTISVTATIHLIALSLAIYALIKSAKLEEEFKKLMKLYDVKISHKVLVDNIQFVFQCCGGYTYTDWYQISNTKSTTKTVLLKEGEEVYTPVPFSCCSKFVSAPCDFRDLEFGLTTINKGGCGHKLQAFVHTLLWFEIVFYLVTFILECTVLGLLSESATETDENASRRNTTQGKPQKWDGFTNSSSSIAALWHTSHSEKKFPIKQRK